MTYHIDSEAISIEEVKAHIQKIDLVPSRISLLENIERKFKVVKKNGVTNLAELRNRIKTAKRIEEFSSVTKLDFEYLNLLRREIESWFSKPHKLKEFKWISESEITNLMNSKYNNSKVLHESITSSSALIRIAKSTRSKVDVLKELVKLSGLTRIQWVNPTVARMLVLGKYETIDDVASADPETLCNKLAEINEEHRFFKGKIGLRDIKRLVTAAAFFANHSCSKGSRLNT